MKIVIKVGTSTLAYPNGSLNIRRTEELCKVMSDLKNAGHEIILVSSGAIGMGVGKLALKEKPTDMPTKQAAAAVGQCELMYVYDKLFSEYSHTVAQILLTASDVRHDERHGNFTNTMNRLLELGVLPIINENDTVSTEEISIGDNDTLAADSCCQRQCRSSDTSLGHRRALRRRSEEKSRRKADPGREEAFRRHEFCRRAGKRSRDPAV